ncbi:MAG: hypothetical protein HW389_2060 [Bacteroidetes bacterium]|nr:hypothetical protein [Bacteroidota bacterium]
MNKSFERILFTGKASNLSIDERLGGYFSEKLPSGGFVENMRVVYADSDRCRNLALRAPWRLHLSRRT